jgi:hypothetical protein
MGFFCLSQPGRAGTKHFEKVGLNFNLFGSNSPKLASMKSTPSLKADTPLLAAEKIY